MTLLVATIYFKGPVPEYCALHAKSWVHQICSPFDIGLNLVHFVLWSFHVVSRSMGHTLYIVDLTDVEPYKGKFFKFHVEYADCWSCTVSQGHCPLRQHFFERAPSLAAACLWDNIYTCSSTETTLKDSFTDLSHWLINNFIESYFCVMMLARYLQLKSMSNPTNVLYLYFFKIHVHFMYHRNRNGMVGIFYIFL